MRLLLELQQNLFEFLSPTYVPDLQEIAHAVNSQKLKSDQIYKTDYIQNVHGKGPADIEKSYPEYEHLRKVGKLASNVSLVQQSC